MRNLVSLVLLAALVCGCTKDGQKPTASEKPKQTLSVNPATATALTGTISFEGVVPKYEPLDMSQDPACVMGGVPANFAQAYVVKDARLANVYVYVKEMDNYSFPAPKEELLVDQNGCRYVPHVAGVMAGQTVRFKNSDPALHNVHPAAKHNQEWNISQQPRGDDIVKTFDTPELMIPVKCNQHPWMKMFLHVSSHPYFAVNAPEDGRAQGLDQALEKARSQSAAGPREDLSALTILRRTL
jgi:plastocyanin